MGIEALFSTQIIDTTTVGRAVMTASDAAAARTAIGAGTSSFSGAYSALSGIPSTFAPSAHKTSHATGGSDALTAADIGAAATSHTHAASDITSGTIDTARLASGTANSTTYLRGDQTWATVAAAGVGGSTGAVDNAVLRADGTGGSTVQSSSIVIADNYTASPNNTVNHASIQAIGGTTNVSVSIVPKGSGAFTLAVPDGSTTGGIARGGNAVDLQTAREFSDQVASGSYSIILAGLRNKATGRAAVAGGYTSTASGSFEPFAYGTRSIASGSSNSWATGYECVSSADYAHARGFRAAADRFGMQAESNTNHNVPGDAQHVRFVVINKTTDGTTSTTLFLNGSSVRLTVPSGKILHATVQIVGSKSDGSAVAVYLRQVAIKNVGGTTSLVGTVNTIGTDTAAGTSIAITADDTNDALQIAVTGVASETWRWVATVVGTELAYGT